MPPPIVNPPEPSGDPKDDPPIFAEQEAQGRFGVSGQAAEDEAAAWTKAFASAEPQPAPGETTVEFEITATGESYAPPTPPAGE
jgi:hypothetical protein